MPDVIRLSEDFWRSSMEESGSRMIPLSSAIVNGNSPFECEAPRNFRISRVRRRFSSSSVLRRMMTLSVTYSSTGASLLPVCSAVMIDVTPISRSCQTTRYNCRHAELNKHGADGIERHSLCANFPDRMIDASHEAAEIVIADHHRFIFRVQRAVYENPLSFALPFCDLPAERG